VDVQPPSEHRFRRGGGALALLAVAVMISLFWSGSARTQHAAPAAPEPVPLEQRTGDCPTCQAMAQRLPAGEFDHDPHEVACRTCHHPHTQKTSREWKQTCTGAGCHVRPWPRTVFHRVNPDVFLNCLNCHRPHTWSLNGEDCASCHGAGPDTLVTAGPGADFDPFPHSRHTGVECAACHESVRKHAVTLITSRSQCQSCHHASLAESSCRSCHGGNQLAAARNVAVKMSIAGDSVIRTVGFRHAIHTDLECRECHGGSAARPTGDLCITCHEFHHDPGTQCKACHATPAPDAHTAETHEFDCVDCHEGSPIPKLLPTRNLCEACHQDRDDHNPGENCNDCHSILPE